MTDLLDGVLAFMVAALLNGFILIRVRGSFEPTEVLSLGSICGRSSYEWSAP